MHLFQEGTFLATGVPAAFHVHDASRGQCKGRDIKCVAKGVYRDFRTAFIVPAATGIGSRNAQFDNPLATRRSRGRLHNL